jgi:hypothetical protein
VIIVTGGSAANILLSHIHVGNAKSLDMLIRPMIETVPLEQAADGYARMMQGKARFRMVLVTKDGVAQSAPVN